jgi:hypothetical protein
LEAKSIADLATFLDASFVEAIPQNPKTPKPLIFKFENEIIQINGSSSESQQALLIY